MRKSIFVKIIFLVLISQITLGACETSKGLAAEVENGNNIYIGAQPGTNSQVLKVKTRSKIFDIGENEEAGAGVRVGREISIMVTKRLFPPAVASPAPASIASQYMLLMMKNEYE